MMIRCLAHNDKTPSMNMRASGWKCFGCQQGGDVIDLVQAVLDIPFLSALKICEERIGVSFGSDDAEVLSLIAAAKRGSSTTDPKADWRRSVREIENRVIGFSRVYMFCGDPLVADIARGPLDSVFQELREASLLPPETDRAKRERLSVLRRAVKSYACWISSEVERITGKDPVTVADQARILRYRKHQKTGNPEKSSQP